MKGTIREIQVAQLSMFPKDIPLIIFKLLSGNIVIYNINSYSNSDKYFTTIQEIFNSNGSADERIQANELFHEANKSFINKKTAIGTIFAKNEDMILPIDMDHCNSVEDAREVIFTDVIPKLDRLGCIPFRVDEVLSSTKKPEFNTTYGMHYYIACKHDFCLKNETFLWLLNHPMICQKFLGYYLTNGINVLRFTGKYKNFELIQDPVKPLYSYNRIGTTRTWDQSLLQPLTVLSTIVDGLKEVSPKPTNFHFNLRALSK